uniref:hypothetical protein n=1 Tax=Crenothrix polyspora TaxID=360316 RepID=UPI0015C66829|nr:hypothetical protein [Crenothrix polyspora]
MASPIWADSNVGTTDNPECTKNGNPVIPSGFINDLMNELALNRDIWRQELEQDPVEQEIMLKGGDTKIHSDLATLKRRPDFQNRLEWWRVVHNLPMIVDCTAKINTPLAADLPPDDEGPYDDTYEGDDLGKLPTVYRAQHSIAENIFTKKVINLLIYDTDLPDGDTVDVLFNEKLILNDVQLPIFTSPRRITLTLEPSDTLPGKTNVLKVVGVRAGTGTLLSLGQTDSLITFGVKGVKGEILYRSEVAITGNGHANILPGKSATGNLALGLGNTQ